MKGASKSKPLCDCFECTCGNCPDILKLLSISIDESVCNITAKTKKKKIGRESHTTDMNRSSINFLRKKTNKLDVINDTPNNRTCVCEAVAQTLRSGIQNNINQDESNKQYSSGHFSKNIK